VEAEMQPGLVAPGRAVQQVTVALEQLDPMASAGELDRDGGTVDPGADDRGPHARSR